MDAAHKFIKAAGLVLIIALVLAVPGWAQPTLNAPANVTFSVGGASAQIASSASPATEITFTVGAPVYANDNNGVAEHWISIPANTGTTPTTLQFNTGNFSGLIQGTHTATVTLTPTAPAGVAPVTITI